MKEVVSTWVLISNTYTVNLDMRALTILRLACLCCLLELPRSVGLRLVEPNVRCLLKAC